MLEARVSLDSYFDFVSPSGWIAAEQIGALARKAGFCALGRASPDRSRPDRADGPAEARLSGRQRRQEPRQPPRKQS
jgi:hypothetical protein